MQITLSSGALLAAASHFTNAHDKRGRPALAAVRLECGIEARGPGSRGQDV